MIAVRTCPDEIAKIACGYRVLTLNRHISRLHPGIAQAEAFRLEGQFVFRVQFDQLKESTTTAMESFGIRIYKEYFNFAAAHFLIFDDGSREELHGHNYQVQMLVEGVLDTRQDIFIDFLHIKPIVKAVCDAIDHRTLLPRFSQYLQVNEADDHVEAIYLGRDRWVFPKRDVVILPVSNTSAERLAQYLCMKTLEALQEKYPGAAIRRVEFSVEESRGQAAIYRLDYPEPQKLSALNFCETLVGV